MQDTNQPETPGFHGDCTPANSSEPASAPALPADADQDGGRTVVEAAVTSPRTAVDASKGGARRARRVLDGRTTAGRRVRALLALVGGAAALPGARAAVEEIAMLERRLAALDVEARRRGQRLVAERRMTRLLERRTELFRVLGLGGRRRR